MATKLSSSKFMVPQGGLEPPRFSATRSKRVKSTIPSPRQKPLCDNTNSIYIKTTVGKQWLRYFYCRRSRCYHIKAREIYNTPYLGLRASHPDEKFGGSGKIRTYDQSRMKTLHYRCATEPIIKCST